MRRIVSLLFLFIFVVLTTAVSQQTAVYSQPIPTNAIRLDLEPISDLTPTAVNDLITGNSCTDSTNLPVSQSGGGGTVYVSGLTTDAGDPDLSSCTWGTPTNSKGYRSAWYQFTTEYAGIVTIKTYGSNYDTIAAVFTGSCGVLQTVSCNDDSEGFASEVTFSATADTIYYLEIADWQSGYAESPLLYIAAWLNPIDSRWETMNSLPSQLSRHATAVNGTDIYVLGGQTSIGTSTKKVYKLDTNTGNWTEEYEMPGNGMTNSTAAYVDGKIYIPGGQDGLGAVSNEHRVYDITSSNPIDHIWSTATPIGGTPLAWSQAVPIHNGYYLTGGSDYTGNTLPPASVNPPTSTITVSDRLLFYRATVATPVWETKASMQAPRFAHVADLVDDKICVAGGLQISVSGDPILVTSGECYNAVNSVWTYTGTMNEPRFAAASAVGADGKWYVFGGLTVTDEGTVVSAVSSEVYDPATNLWKTLSPAYNLGRLDDRQGYVLPNRTWAAGGAVGDYIWAIGGNIPINSSTMPLVERLRTYQQYGILTYLPVISNAQENTNFNTMATAMPIYLSSPRWDAFNEQQFYHAYVFDVYSTGVTTINMSDIASGNDYDLFLYDNNKGLVTSSVNPGNSDENIQRNLAAGRYYVMVKRTNQINANDTYRLIVQR